MSTIRLVREFMALIKAHEYEKATSLVDKAEKTSRAENFNERRDSIHQINLALLEAKKQRDVLYATIDDYPEQERLFLRAQIDRICQSFLDPEIADLRIQKRRLSKY